MAELAIVASIVGLLSAGAKLSIGIFDFAATLGSAGAELQAVGTEVSLFCSVVKQLQGTLLNATLRYSPAAVDAAQEIVDRCEGIFGEINDILEGLKGSRGPDSIPTVDFVAKAKWTFKKSKVQLLRSTLESCKITLHIMLTTMEVARKVSLRVVQATTAEDRQDQMITQSLIMSQQCAIDELERLEDEREREELPANKRLGHRVHTPKVGNRLSRAVSGNSMTSAATPEASPPPSRAQRASVWLNSILFGNDAGVTPHPGSKLRKRYSSVDTEGKPLELLRKWTELSPHTKASHDALDHERASTPDELWGDDVDLFSFPDSPIDGASVTRRVQVEPLKIAPIQRAPTDTVSPTTTVVVADTKPVGFGVSQSLFIPQRKFHVNSDELETALEITSAVLARYGTSCDPSEYHLCVAYGGKVRALKCDDNPAPIVWQYAELGLDPQVFILKAESGDRV